MVVVVDRMGLLLVHEVQKPNEEGFDRDHVVVAPQLTSIEIVQAV